VRLMLSERYDSWLLRPYSARNPPADALHSCIAAEQHLCCLRQVWEGIGSSEGRGASAPQAIPSGGGLKGAASC
jgi:hypothetical protein